MKRKGFTLIEILLVVVIIGIMLAVIVPRAWRANIDTKYGVVRQNATELAAYGNQWVEQGIQTQSPDTSTSTAINYLAALCGVDNAPVVPSTDSRTEWVAENTGRRSWAAASSDAQRNRIYGRVEATGTNNTPEEQVIDLIPPEKQILNPFNGVSVFAAPNLPGTADQPVSGALACGGTYEGDFVYVALVFQGTDSTTVDTGPLHSDTTFHAGMSTSLQGLRNGIFLARARQMLLDMKTFIYGGREIMNNKKGFTLIEILLVVVIIGIMLAVIVPRAWRANVDTKYGLVRQNGAEMASFAMQWVEDCIQSQDPQNATAVAANYYASLSGGTTTTTPTALWVANPTSNPWVSDTPPNVPGRVEPGSTNTAPESPVKALVPPEKIMTNPFNGLNVFAAGNYPSTTPVNGALACGMGARETDGWYYVALLFQGTDSTAVDVTSADTFYAGQDYSTQGLRNGIFVARVQYKPQLLLYIYLLQKIMRKVEAL